MLSREEVLSRVRGYEPWQKLSALSLIALSGNASKDDVRSIMAEELLKGECTGFLKAHTNDNTFSSQQLGDLIVWEQNVDSQLSVESSGLESKLLNAKSSTIKEAIRQCHIDLGNLLRRWGRLDDSYKQYLKARDFCSTPQHQVDCCFRLIAVSFDLQNFQSARSFASKIFDISTDHIVRSKAAAFEGILHTMAGHFRTANESFLSIGCNLDDLGTIQLADLALCGGLCILATSNRADILKMFSSSNIFIKQILLNQPALRTLIFEYANGNYCNCVSFLEQAQPILQSNLFLREIYPQLVKAIHEKLLFQYLQPYEVVAINDVSASLQVTGDFVERVVASLITKKLLVAKIDLEKQVIMKSTINVSAKIIEEALLLTSSHVFAVEKNFIHSSMLRQSMSNTEGSNKSNKRMGDPSLLNTDALEYGNDVI